MIGTFYLPDCSTRRFFKETGIDIEDTPCHHTELSLTFHKALVFFPWIEPPQYILFAEVSAWSLYFGIDQMIPILCSSSILKSSK